jgi:hypothetical protein
VCCQWEVSASGWSLVQRSPVEVVCHNRVWYWSLDNEVVLALWGLLCHGIGIFQFMEYVWWLVFLHKKNKSSFPSSRSHHFKLITSFILAYFWWFSVSDFQYRFDYYYYYYYYYLTAVSLTPGVSSTEHIYTQTVHRIQRTEHT